MSKTPCPLLKNSRKSLGCPWRYIIYSSYITCFYIPRSFLILHKRSQPMPNILHPPSLLRSYQAAWNACPVLSCPDLTWNSSFSLHYLLYLVKMSYANALSLLQMFEVRGPPAGLLENMEALSWTFLLLLQNMVSLSCHLFPPVLY